MNHLKNQLQSTDESERLYAITDISEQMNDEIFCFLLEHLQSETSGMVKDKLVSTLSCAIGAQEVNSERAFAGVFALYLNHDAFLRSCAVHIFAVGTDVVVEFLAANMTDANTDVRKLIIDTLGIICTERALQIIHNAIHDTDVNVRITAIEHLGNNKAESCVPELVAIVETEKRPMIVLAAIEAIEKIGKPDDYRKVIDLLVPNADLSKISSIYFSALLTLIAHSWPEGAISKMLTEKKITENYETYPVEIVNLLTIAIDRFIGFVDRPEVINTLIELLSTNNMRERIPFITINLLSKSEQKWLREELDVFYDQDVINIETFARDIVQLLNQRASRR